MDESNDPHCFNLQFVAAEIGFAKGAASRLSSAEEGERYPVIVIADGETVTFERGDRRFCCDQAELAAIVSKVDTQLGYLPRD
jgi:hypothetical protein